MKFAAIFIAWADCADLLPYAVENIRPVVDEVFIVWSRASNHGQEAEYELPKGCTLIQWEPVRRAPSLNELAKRNIGLEAVKAAGFTHFIMMDADEFYVMEDFEREKGRIEDKDLGTVARVKTYFGRPTLTIGYDHTLVPFIHKVSPALEYKLNFKGYPFAYQRGAAYIDPTRRLNITQGVRMADITMHHYSYVRKNMMLKFQNSSANLRGSRGDAILEDLKNAAPGYFCRGYQKMLKQTENIFNLPIYD